MGLHGDMQSILRPDPALHPLPPARALEFLQRIVYPGRESVHGFSDRVFEPAVIHTRGSETRGEGRIIAARPRLRLCRRRRQARPRPNRPLPPVPAAATASRPSDRLQSAAVAPKVATGRAAATAHGDLLQCPGLSLAALANAAFGGPSPAEHRPSFRSVRRAAANW